MQTQTKLSVLAILLVFGIVCKPTLASADEPFTKLVNERHTLTAQRAESLSLQVGSIATDFDCEIEIDEKAFAAEKRPQPDKTVIDVPDTGSPVCLDSALRIVLVRARAVYEIRAKKIVVVPNTQNGRARTFPPLTEGQLRAQRELRDYLRKTEVEVKNDTTVTDIQSGIETLLGNYDVAFVIDQKRIGKQALERDGRVRKGTHTLDAVIRMLVGGADATYQLGPDYIAIVPAEKS